MASNEDKTSNTETSNQDVALIAPVKKATAKRAPRKATKKASTPTKAPPVEIAGVDAPLVDSLQMEAVDANQPAALKTAARKVAKRAPRKTAKKVAAVPLVDADTAAPSEPTSITTHETTPPPTTTVIPGFGLLFQAPEPTEAPRRRRASAPAAAPEPAPTNASPEAAAEQRSDTPPDSTDDADDAGADGSRHRRRRGGKGRRGRSGSEVNPEESGSDSNVAEDAATPSTEQPRVDADGSEEDAASHRRTRRRRRGASGEGDESQGTTTRVREPRQVHDEVTAVKGSTRLEAKKQRRREGRESGRRRTVITEAEFLARRESVERVMVVRHKEDRTQIGVLEDGVLVEHYVSREVNASMAGNVYLARIQNVLPSMEAAFADIGRGRNAVLYAGEVNWDAAGLENNRARRIENALSSGQSVLVQVTKDPIGHKGARLTSQISLPGRYLVYVPDGNMMGISRKLPDIERARLKKILREVVPDHAGVIVRTAAEGASEDELRADVTRLTATWEEIKAKSKSANAPSLLHGEPDLTVRVIRDVFNEDFASLIVSGDPAWETVNGYVNTVAPDLADRIQKWTGEQDLFTHYRVNEQIAKAMDRKVWLPSGGSLVIDRTEAMTVIDVNTGKFVGSGGNLEETVTKNNIEAAEEIVRQLRLRDIGGIIVIDFIDMVLESNRDLVVRRMLECLGRDRTKHQVAEVTSLGLVQMTRKRVGGGLIEVFSETCEHCNGRGFIISADPIDEPSSSNGSSGSAGPSGHNGSSNSGNSGSNEAGSGRSGRGRRARGSGRDSGDPVLPEPKSTPEGPTPAQIAAASIAAAIHAASHPESTAPVNEPSFDQPQETLLEVAEVAAPEVPVGAAEVAAPARSRRRSSRSAKSPAVSVEHVVAPPIAAPPELQRVEVLVTPREPAPISSVPDVAAPATHGRRKRARVMAPAGPPPAVSVGSASGEFDS
jgi:ribonuclease E